jgi:hypothetical protein
MTKFYSRNRLSNPLAEEPPEDDYEDEDLDSEENETNYDDYYEPEDIDYDSLAWDSLNDWEDSRGI